MLPLLAKVHMAMLEQGSKSYCVNVCVQLAAMLHSFSKVSGDDMREVAIVFRHQILLKNCANIGKIN